MNYSIIRLRAIAIIAVILLHAASSYLFKPMGSEWMVGNVVDGLTRFCVPLFLMISGALLLTKKESNLLFFKKRLAKLTIPFISWSVFYFFALINFDLSKIEISTFVKQFVQGDISFHLWYLYLLFPLYFLIPILKNFAQNSSTKIIVIYIMGFVLVDNAAIVLKTFYGLNLENYLTSIFPYIGYLLLGYVIYDREFLSEHRKKVYIAGIISAVTIVVGTYLLSLDRGGYHDFFYRYSSISVFIYTVAIVVYVKNLRGEPSKLITAISTYSFGIYLVHIYYRSRLGEWISPLSLDAVQSIFLSSAITFILSFTTVWAISKIPYLRKTL